MKTRRGRQQRSIRGTVRSRENASERGDARAERLGHRTRRRKTTRPAPALSSRRRAESHPHAAARERSPPNSGLYAW